MVGELTSLVVLIRWVFEYVGRVGRNPVNILLSGLGKVRGLVS